jgi:hypothetical protein
MDCKKWIFSRAGMITIICLAIVVFGGVFVFRYFSEIKEAQQRMSQVYVITADNLKNATLTYPNPYDVSQNDTINLVDGKALIRDTDNSMPRGYTLATTAIGDLNKDGAAEGILGLYQGYGANIIRPVIFVFSSKNGELTQIDSALPLEGTLDDAIKSLSINNGVLSVKLLVVSDADLKLPHYQQEPTVEKIVQYKLINEKLVEQ